MTKVSEKQWKTTISASLPNFLFAPLDFHFLVCLLFCIWLVSPNGGKLFDQFHKIVENYKHCFPAQSPDNCPYWLRFNPQQLAPRWRSLPSSWQHIDFKSICLKHHYTTKALAQPNCLIRTYFSHTCSDLLSKYCLNICEHLLRSIQTCQDWVDGDVRE